MELPHLDTLTIIAAAAATGFLLAQAMVLLSMSLRGYRGPGFWAAGSLGLAFSSLLIALQGHLAPLWGVVLGNSGVMISLCLICHGLALFLERPPRHGVYMFVSLSTLGGFVYFGLVHPFFAGRAVTFSLCFAYLMADMSWLLYQAQDDHREPSFIFVLLSCLMAVIFNLLRVAAVLQNPQLDQGLLAPDSVGSLVLLAYTLNTTAMLVGLIMLASARFARQLAQANRVLERQSFQDGLTGLFNRRFLDQYLERELLRAQREQSILSVVMLDIDHFKAYNDTYGHLAGDECLKSVARAIEAAAKRPADVAARFGGEEFVLVLPATDLHGALVLAEGLRAGVQRLCMLHGSSPVAPCVTVSLGVACLAPPERGTPEQLLSLADETLYLAKKQGRNRVRGAQACFLRLPAHLRAAAGEAGHA